MFSARSRSRNRSRSRKLGLRTRLTLWSTLLLAASLAAGFAWVHYGLRRVLEARNDAFLHRQATELLALVNEHWRGSSSDVEEEIRREILAYEPEGLIVAIRQPGRVSIAPDTEVAHRIVQQGTTPGTPRTVSLAGSRRQYRVLAVRAGDDDLTLQLGISLAETEATLLAFDRFVAGGALAFLVLAALGGLFFSRQAVRPVAASIRAARRLDPENLDERLPLTGAGDELDELAATINGLLDRLATYHAQIIRFTADASHELRSPLAAMRAAVEIALQRPRDPDEYRTVLATLGEQSERLTALVNGLLLLARADAGEVAIRREAVDLSALASDVVEMFEPLAEECGIRLAAEAAGPVILAGDPSRLRQLITNLVDNAVRFTEPGGEVALRVQTRADRVILRVKDTGIGIPADSLPHVFERFYQADDARRSGGCGLGLSICHWIAKAHGGTISAESREGQGTEFTVAFPVAAADRKEPTSAAAGT